MSFSPLILDGQCIDPPLLVAPMAGITHAAFRRLVAGFGGYGAMFTEMLPARLVLSAGSQHSPHLKRRAEEGRVVYQLLLSAGDDVVALGARLRQLGVFGIDVNLACPAPAVTRRGGGAALFRTPEPCGLLLGRLRDSWHGPLSVKIRLGDQTPTWRETLIARLRLFKSIGIDAVIVHPRFFAEKLKRRARWEIFEWLLRETNMRIVGNGDVVAPNQVSELLERYPAMGGIMVGRIVAVQPWFFCLLSGRGKTKEPINYRQIWDQFFEYVIEDFPHDRCLGKIKEFNAYFARNFLFGHELFRAVQAAASLDAAQRAARAFLSRPQPLMKQPSVDGL